ncbi:transposase [Actinoplanes sp. NPDC024001]|uniref:transposase n=1 Tax=Actinoplanes sp. NPDC024001 TaxID=3154598 RepID=UPI0033F9999E
MTVAVVWSRELPCDPTSVRVYQDNLGHWYASFVVRREIAAVPDADLPGLGIDWGVKTTATTTDPGFDLPHLGHRRRCAAELAKAQRKMARRRRPKGQAPSKGYQAAKAQAARIAKKAARQNTHDARVWAKNVTEHHALIAVEDSKPKFLAKTTMARNAARTILATAERHRASADDVRHLIASFRDGYQVQSELEIQGPAPEGSPPDSSVGIVKRAPSPGGRPSGGR